MTGSVCLWALLKSGNKGFACSFFQQWVTCCFSTVIMSQTSGLQSPVWFAVCTVAGLKLLAALRFMEKSMETAVYLFLCRVSIYIGLWVGGAWEMKTASMDWTTESKEQGVGPLKKLPDQTSARQVCLRWLSWSPGWPWACYCWGWPLVPHPPSLPPKC